MLTARRITALVTAIGAIAVAGPVAGASAATVPANATNRGANAAVQTQLTADLAPAQGAFAAGAAAAQSGFAAGLAAAEGGWQAGATALQGAFGITPPAFQRPLVP